VTADTRRVPRLLAILDSIETPAEIVATVHRLRKTLGPGGFAKLAAEPDRLVSLKSPDHAIGVRLRALGLALRWARHSDPRVSEALQRTSYALAQAEALNLDDLLLALAFLDEAAEPRLPADRLDLGAELRDSMGLLSGLMRR
jgi:hypothetical protein